MSQAKGLAVKAVHCVRRLVGGVIAGSGVLWLVFFMNTCVSYAGTPEGHLPINELPRDAQFAFIGMVAGPILWAIGCWIWPKTKAEERSEAK